jgi:hypothetical protein
MRIATETTSADHPVRRATIPAASAIVLGACPSRNRTTSIRVAFTTAEPCSRGPLPGRSCVGAGGCLAPDRTQPQPTSSEWGRTSLRLAASADRCGNSARTTGRCYRESPTSDLSMPETGAFWQGPDEPSIAIAPRAELGAYLPPTLVPFKPRVPWLMNTLT